MENCHIDDGTPFDFGRASVDYAKYRDIYPSIFYDKILKQGLCIKGQKVLDIGTGTGVLPRNMYINGADFVGTDISENQIQQAKSLSAGKNITYAVMSAEKLKFAPATFDVITACQCYWYFDHEKTAPVFYQLLKENGSLALLRMDWLPNHDSIAAASEALVLKYNPKWSGGGQTMRSIEIPDHYEKYFELVYHEEYLLSVPFTRETWNGRMKSCRGIGATLSEKEVNAWEKEHLALLEKIAPVRFDIQHYVAMAILRKK